MKAVDTIVSARWIIPVEPDNTVLENASLVVHQGKIVDLLPTVNVDNQYTSSTHIRLDNHALMPGMVNAHAHASMSLLRGIADDLPLMDWLQNHIWPLEGKFVSAQFVYDGTQLAIAESIKSGVTCFNEMYFFPDEAARAAIDASMRACIGLIMIDFPTVWASNADEYLDKALNVHDRFNDHPLISTAFAPHAPYTVSDAPLEKIRTYAEELDIPIHMHIHETAHEVNDAVAKNGKRPLQRLDELGLLSPRLLAVHMTQLTDTEIARCAETGVHVLHCPESNMKLASGFCPVAKLIDAGVNVAIGTDGAASNNDLDMLGEARTAALLAKVVAGDPTAVPAHTALRMATLNGAKALGLEGQIGSLQRGKEADFIAINMHELETLPVYDAVSHILYSSSRHHVTDVWIAGKRVLNERKLTTINENDLRSKVGSWAKKITRQDHHA